METFDFEVMGMGFNDTGYPGAFTPTVRRLIMELVYGKVLNLYSGCSIIGQERVDISHPNATVHSNVDDFILLDDRYWDWVVLDPPYAITRADSKLAGYGLKMPVSANVVRRRLLKRYFQKHTDNVLWLDFSAPMVDGFKRQKLWLLLPGGFHTVRVLSWLKRRDT